jgi:hypothetical protein
LLARFLQSLYIHVMLFAQQANVASNPARFLLAGLLLLRGCAR